MEDSPKPLPARKSRWKLIAACIVMVTIVSTCTAYIVNDYRQGVKMDQALALPIELGLPSSPQDLIPLLAEFDSERRTALIRLLKADLFESEVFRDQRENYFPADPDQYRRDQLVQVAHRIHATNAWRLEVLAELRAGAPFPSSLSWKTAPEQLLDYAHIDGSPPSSETPGSRQLKIMGAVWGQLVVLGDAGAWESLTLLTKHQDPPGSLIDHMIYMKIVELRSRAALEALLASAQGWAESQGDPLKAWMEEPLILAPRLKTAMTAERVLWLTPIAKFFQRESFLTKSEILTSVSSCGQNPSIKDVIYFVSDFATALKAHALVECRFDSGSPHGTHATMSDILPYGCNGFLHLIISDYSSNLKKILRIHALKLAAKICLLQREGGSLPQNKEELIAALGEECLATEPDFPRLSYECAGPDKFRVFPDASMAPTWLFPRGTGKDSYHPSNVNKPIIFFGCTLIVDIAAARIELQSDSACIRQALRDLQDQPPTPTAEQSLPLIPSHQ